MASYDTIDARSRILPGVGYLLESDITHDPPVVVVSGCPLVKYSEEENSITLLVFSVSLQHSRALASLPTITPGY